VLANWFVLAIFNLMVALGTAQTKSLFKEEGFSGSERFLLEGLATDKCVLFITKCTPFRFDLLCGVTSEVLFRLGCLVVLLLTHI